MVIAKLAGLGCAVPTLPLAEAVPEPGEKTRSKPDVDPDELLFDLRYEARLG